MEAASDTVTLVISWRGGDGVADEFRQRTDCYTVRIVHSSNAQPGFALEGEIVGTCRLDSPVRLERLRRK